MRCPTCGNDDTLLPADEMKWHLWYCCTNCDRIYTKMEIIFENLPEKQREKFELQDCDIIVKKDLPKLLDA